MIYARPNYRNDRDNSFSRVTGSPVQCLERRMLFAAPELSTPLEGGVVGDIGSISSGYHYAWAPSLVEMPNRDLVCVWYGGPAEMDFANSGLYYAVKPEGSSTWTPTQALFNNASVFEVNPTLYLKPDGNLWCFYRAYANGHDGNTSGTPNFIGDLTRATLAYNASSRTLNVLSQSDPLVGTNNQVLPLSLESGTPPVVTADGALILGVTDKSFNRTGVIRSIDGGAHWTYQDIPQNEPSNVTTPKHAMPAVQRLSDGTLVAYTRTWQYKPPTNPTPNWSLEHSFRSASTDNGVTWSQPTLTNIRNPNARMGWINQPDNTQLVANNQMFRTESDTATGRRQLDLMRSTDGGTTWVDKTIEYHPTGEFGYPWMLRASDGFTYVVYGARPTAIKWAKINSAWFDAPAAPAAPSNFDAGSSTSTTSTLTWTDNSDNETGFKIERKIGAGGTYAQIATVAANTTLYVDQFLAPSTIYYYRVRASNAVGDSGFSNENGTTTQAPYSPAAPTNLTAVAVMSTQINLAWTDNSNNETSFKIERKPGSNGVWTQIASVGPNTSSFSDNSVAVSTTYYYRVCAATTLASDSSWSNETFAVTSNDLFFDDFNDGNSNNWSNIGGWSVGNHAGHPFALISTQPTYDQMNIATQSGWSNYSLSAWVNVNNPTGGSAGIVGRYTNFTTNYELRIGNGSNSWQLVRRNGSVATLASGSVPYTAGSWIMLRLDFNGSALTASCSNDGSVFTTLASVTDATLASGKVGVHSTTTTAGFDDVWVRVPAPVSTGASLNIDSRSVSFVLDSSISSASVAATDLQIIHLTTNQTTTNATAVSLSPDGRTLTFTLPVNLPDGNYRFRIPAGSISGSNGAPTAGDLDLSGSNVFIFGGDATRDRLVDTQDFNLLAANFGLAGRVFSQGNFNYDTTIDSQDFGILVSQFGKRLLPAAAPLLGTGSAVTASTSLPRMSFKDGDDLFGTDSFEVLI